MSFLPHLDTKNQSGAQLSASWTLLQNSNHGYLLLDRDRIVCEVNPALAKAMRCKPKALVHYCLDSTLPELADGLEPVLQRLFCLGHDSQQESLEIVLSQDGSNSRHWKASCSLVSTGDGQSAVAILFEDTTSQHKLAKMLVEGENRFRSTFDSAATGMALVDLSGNLFRANRALCNMMGYQESELVGQSLASLTHPDDLEEDLVAFQRMFRGEISEYRLDKRYVRSDGTILWGLLNAAIVRGVDGSPLYAIGEVQDITKNKLAFDAVQQSEQLYRDLAESLPQLVWIADANGIVQSVNERAVEYIGRETIDEIWPDWQPLVHPDDLEETVRRWSESVAAKTAIDIQFRFLRFDGQYRWHISRAIPIFAEDGEVKRWLGTLTDIHSQKMAQQAIDASERRFRAVLERSFDCVKLISADGIVKYISPSSQTLFDAKPEERLGKPAFELTHPDDVNFVHQQFNEVLKAPGVPLSWSYRIRQSNGSIRWLEAWGTNLLHDSDVEAVVINLRDITQDKQNAETQERLRSERNRVLKRLQVQVETMPIGLIVTDEEFRLTEWNPAAQKIFGHRKEDVVGKRFDELRLVEESHVESVEGIAERLLAGGDMAHGTHRNLTRDGEFRECEWYLAPLMGDGGNFEGVLGIVVDVTERLQLEEQFRQAQKMEAIGRLAGGIAHDFNNLLTVINGYAEVLLDDGPNTKAQNLLLEICRAGERAARLTDQLLSFSRKKEQKRELLQLSEVVRNMESMLRSMIGEDVELFVDYRSDLPYVHVDRTQVEQVLMNLAVNARDAMPEGGRLSISIDSLEIAEQQAMCSPTIRDGNYVRMVVSDTGTGMSDHVKKQIFDPFFTTKEVGKGTGLGLSTVYGVITQNGGSIHVESTSGEGTKFEVFLPIAKATQARIRLADTSQMQGNGETILLVEDDQSLRNVVKTMLNQLGYHVLAAENAAEAKKLASVHRESIQLLLTDVVMPEMGGGELYQCLVTELPKLRVLFMSGYTQGRLSQYNIGGSEDLLLRKPFSRSTLAQRVHKSFSTSSPWDRNGISSNDRE